MLELLIHYHENPIRLKFVRILTMLLNSRLMKKKSIKKGFYLDFSKAQIYVVMVVEYLVASGILLYRWKDPDIKIRF